MQLHEHQEWPACATACCTVACAPSAYAEGVLCSSLQGFVAAALEHFWSGAKDEKQLAAGESVCGIAAYAPDAKTLCAWYCPAQEPHGWQRYIYKD